MKLTYRPEIDGLRAIAVGAVILYHAQITFLGLEPFKGGFIGVDIFFVISGYLITSIILKELVTTGSFSFKYFYERRVRRILPALLFVMLVSIPFAWMYLLPSSFIDFSKSILYSLGFSSNFYFWYSGQQYGAESGLLKPFLHTWSLSVEEQYYILFPIVLLITFKYFKKYLIHILIFCFIISLGLADWSSRNYPSASFYFLHTRMWELLAGSILAYFEITIGHRSQNKILNFILPFIGLILIGHSILFFNDEMYHPSFYTLSPIIGVCLIIWFSNKDELFTKILSTRLFVGIGLISYSLYLWHYPIFAFVKITGIVTGSVANKLLLIPILFICSIFSYYYIEKPARIKKYQFQKLIIILSSSICFLIFFNSTILKKDGYEKRLPEVLRAKLSENNVDFYQSNNTQKVVLIGDSHAGALEFSLNEEIKKKNLSLFRLRTRLYLHNFNYIDKHT
jgi:peptidoglycan/LPS O-acetylase OafA/YrhL